MHIAFLTIFLVVSIVSALPQAGNQSSAHDPLTYNYRAYPNPDHPLNIQTANAALVAVLRIIGYQGHASTDLVPDEGWTGKALGVVFNIQNQLGPLHFLRFREVEDTIRVMRDFYHRMGIACGVEVEIWYGSLLIGTATLRMDDEPSMAGESSVQVAKRLPYL